MPLNVRFCEPSEYVTLKGGEPFRLKTSIAESPAQMPVLPLRLAVGGAATCTLKQVWLLPQLLVAVTQTCAAPGGRLLKLAEILVPPPVKLAPELTLHKYVTPVCGLATE